MIAEVLGRMDELANPEIELYEDVISRQPGPLETGELGFTIDDQEDL